MRNVKRIAEISKTKRVSLFYSPKEDAVFNSPGEGRFYLTDLIRANTEAEIKDTVKRFMAM